jgi:hypothetical protein
MAARPPSSPPESAPESAAPTTTTESAPAGREESHAEKLYRAQSVELEALRRQLESLPDADSLATFRAKAEQFDQLAGELPKWRESLAATFQGEQAALRQQLEAQQQQLSAKARETAALQSFIAAGGEPKHFAAFHQLIADHLQPGEDGQLLCNATGESQPLEKALKALSEDAGSIWPSFFRPAFGTGSGARPTVPQRPPMGNNFRNLSKEDKFRVGFGSR